MEKKLMCFFIIGIFLITGFSTAATAKIESKDDEDSFVIVTLERNGKKLTDDSAFSFWRSYAVFASDGEGYCESFTPIGSEPYEVNGKTLSNCFYWFLEKDKKFTVGVNFMRTPGNRIRKSEIEITPTSDVEEITLEWESSFSKSRLNLVFDNLFFRIIENLPILKILQ